MRYTLNHAQLDPRLPTNTPGLPPPHSAGTEIARAIIVPSAGMALAKGTAWHGTCIGKNCTNQGHESC